MVRPESLKPATRAVRRRVWPCRAALVLPLLLAAAFGCGGEATDMYPLAGADDGLVGLRWGEGMETARAKMLHLKGLTALSDTSVMIEDEPLFVTADSVIPPRVGDLSYEQLRFAGGTFLGSGVEQWQLWFTKEGSLRILEIVFSADAPHDEVYDDLGNKLLALYGVPERGGVVWKKFRSRDWTERHADGEQPATGALLTWGKIPGHVTLTYHDVAYADSLDAIPYGEPVGLRQWQARENAR